MASAFDRVHEPLLIISKISCREGLPKPALTSKRVSGDTKISALPITITALANVPLEARSETTSKTTSKKIAEKENTDLVNLDSLHKQAGVNKSLRLPEGKRIKLKVETQSRKQRAEDINFEVDLADIKEQLDDENDENEDMPDTKELIADAQSAQLKGRKEDSDYSGDSELDAIMLTVDTENLPIASQNVNLMTEKTESAHSHQSNTTEKQQKQKASHPRSPESLSPAFSSSLEPCTKKAKTDDDYKQSDDDVPLFLHKASSSSAFTPADRTYGPILSEEDYYGAEFAPDSTLFDIIPPELNDASTKSHPCLPADPCDLDGPNDSHSVLNVRTEYKQREQDEHLDAACNDDWADLVDWMENSGAVIVDHPKAGPL